MRNMTSVRWGSVGVVAVLAFSGACGSGGSKASSTSAPKAKTATITASDYRFDGLPGTVAPGTKLALTNASTKEVHELVVYRLPDSEKRSVAELVKLPETELDAVLTGPPTTVLVAPPGGAPQINALGDGTLTQAGRYMVFCTIPTGAVPADYLKAMQSAGPGTPPPSVAGGAPHLANGMFGEVTVK